MLHNIFDYIKKNHILLYILLGALTTAVNYLVYFPLYNVMCLSASLCNLIAWAVAVIFAYLTNKPLVFESLDWSPGVTVPEFAKFVGGRLISGLIETAFIFLTVDMLLWNGNIMKIIISVFVVIFNYFISKILVFNNKQ